MGLRWTRNDESAYRTFKDAGESIKQGLLERDLGEAWKSKPEEVESYETNEETGDVTGKKQYKFRGKTQDKAFTDDEITRERANAAADVYASKGKPEQAFGLRAKAKADKAADLQAEAAGLQLKGAKRADRQADTQDQAMNIARQVALGQLPEHEGIRMLATLHGPIPDGMQAYVTQVNGKPHAVLGNDNDRTSQLIPIAGDGKTFNQALGHFLSLLSPQSYDAERKHGLAERTAAAGERTAATGERNAATNEQYRKDQAPVLAAQARNYDANADRARREPMGGHNALYGYQLEQQKAFDKEKRGVLEKLDAGEITETQADSQLRRISMKYGGGSGLGKPGKQGIQPLQGNPGMFSDGETLFRMDERTNQLVEVPTPKSLKDLGRGITENLAGGRGGPRVPGAPDEPRGLANVLDAQRPRRSRAPAEMNEDDRMQYP